MKALAPLTVTAAMTVTSWAKETIFAVGEVFLFRVVNKAEPIPVSFACEKKAVDDDELKTEGARVLDIFIHQTLDSQASPSLLCTWDKK